MDYLDQFNISWRMEPLGMDNFWLLKVTLTLKLQNLNGACLLLVIYIFCKNFLHPHPMAKTAKRVSLRNQYLPPSVQWHPTVTLTLGFDITAVSTFDDLYWNFSPQKNWNFKAILFLHFDIWPYRSDLDDKT